MKMALADQQSAICGSGSRGLRRRKSQVHQLALRESVLTNRQFMNANEFKWQTVNRVSHPSSNNPGWRTGHKWLMLDASRADSLVLIR